MNGRLKALLIIVAVLLIVKPALAVEGYIQN